MKKKLLLLLVILLSSIHFNTNASHAAGGYFSYTCVSGNTYQVCLTLWRDCFGIQLPTQIPINLTSNCGGSASVTLTQTAVSGVEVSQLCQQQLPNSRCASPPGTLQGFRQHVYCGTVTLNPACANWNMSYQLCCRNNNISNITTPQNTIFALTGSINNFNASCPNNNSPLFTSQPIPYVCTGQQVNFNPSILEPDGDSLVFTLISAITPTGNVIYSGTNSATNPFGTTSPTAFNTSTGQLTFTPNTPGVYVVVIQVCEWRNGVQLGCLMREFQIVVQTCNNIVPTMPIGIDSFQGSGTVIDSNSVLVCVGDSFSFSLLFVDSLMLAQTVGDSITITTNASAVLPGANVTVINGNPAWMQITWLTSPGSPSFNIFTVTIQDNACPVPGQNTYQFDISVIPATYAGPDQTICGYQDTAHINVVGGDTFTWSVLAGEPIIPGVNFRDTTGLTGTPVWAKPSVTTTYQVVSNLFGQCVNTDTITVFVREIDLPNDTILCKGDTMTLDVYNTMPCGTGTELYFWSPTIGLDNPNVRNPLLTIQPNQSSTMYSLVYDDGCGCQTQDSFMVYVSDIDIANTIINKYQCNIDDGEITINVIGGYSPYQFSIDSGLNFFPNNFFDSLDIGIYNVIVKDSVGCWSNVSVDTILDINSPIIDSINIKDVSCFAANDGEIEIFGSGGTLPYTYSINTVVFQVNNIFTNLTSSTYQVQIRDSLLCKSLPSPVIINTNPQMFVDSIIPINLICFEENFGSISVFGNGGTSPLTYSIDSGNTYTSSNIFSLLSADTYNVIIRDASGCITTPQPIILTQPSKLELGMTITFDSCFNSCGGRASAIGSGGILPYSFNWYGHGINTNQSNNLCAGIYQFRITDNNGCFVDTNYVVVEPTKLEFNTVLLNNISCNGFNDGFLSVSLSGGIQPYYYSLDTLQTITQNPTFTQISPSSYILTAFDSGFRCRLDTIIHFVEPSTITLTTPYTEKTICISQCDLITTSISGGWGNYSYQWINSTSQSNQAHVCPDTQTTYTVLGLDSAGCPSNPISITIKLYDSLRVTAFSDTAICDGDTAILSAVGSGAKGNGYRYSWTGSRIISTPFNSNIMVSPKFLNSNFYEYKYIVKLDDDCGTPSAYDSVTINVHSIPSAQISIRDTTKGCTPFYVTLSPSTYSFGVTDWKWTINENTFRGATVDLDGLTPGVYNVTLEFSNTIGCSNKNIYDSLLIVYPNPTAKFDLSTEFATFTNTVINFTDKSSGDVTEWDWNFNYLGNSSSKSPSFQFPQFKSTHEIYLTVSNKWGCTDFTSKTLNIENEFNIFIPTAFTPNNDGLNDIFIPIGLEINPNKYQLTIYDRWGGIVFETTNPSEGWDGSVNGSRNLCSNGVYVWILYAASLISNETIEKTGTINLIR